MLLGETTRDVIFVIAIVLAVLAIAGGLVSRASMRGALPSARALSKRSRSRQGLEMVAWVATPLFLGIAYWATTFELHVLEVRDGRSKYGDRVFERKLGRKPLAFALADGDPDAEPWLGKPCWIVNASSKPIRRLAIEYTTNDKPFVVKREIVIQPGQRASDCHIDYFGRDFSPPETLREQAYARSLTADWLTW